MRLEPNDSTLFDFVREFLVVCPNCSRQAVVRDRGEAATPRVALTCAHCGHSELRDPDSISLGGPVDGYFGRPLWLQAPCCGETLWAYNAAHLEFIEEYVRATLREHARGPDGWRNQALRNRLPRWMKAAGNREAILKCIEQLKEKLS
jgi:hypothetical protein